MKTRSQTKIEEAKNIAEFTPAFFQQASKAWMKNKEQVAQGMYRYKEDAPRRSPRLQTKEKN